MIVHVVMLIEFWFYVLSNEQFFKISISSENINERNLCTTFYPTFNSNLNINKMKQLKNHVDRLKMYAICCMLVYIKTNYSLRANIT